MLNASVPAVVSDDLKALVEIMPLTLHERGSIPALGVGKIGRTYLSRAMRRGLLTKDEARSDEYICAIRDVLCQRN